MIERCVTAKQLTSRPGSRRKDKWSRNPLQDVSANKAVMDARGFGGDTFFISPESMPSCATAGACDTSMFSFSRDTKLFCHLQATWFLCLPSVSGVVAPQFMNSIPSTIWVANQTG